MTAQDVLKQTALFILAGALEIGGGYGVWVNAKRGTHYRYLGLIGSLALIAYGWVQTLQEASFGRLYAVYGGYFIVLSLLWGWGFDGTRPDVGDVVGGAIALMGVLTMLYWPR